MAMEEKPNLEQIYSLVGKTHYVDQVRSKIEQTLHVLQTKLKGTETCTKYNALGKDFEDK